MSLAKHQKLIADYADGTITAEDLKQLESLLQDDQQLRNNFIEYLNVDSALSDLAALSDAEFYALSIADVDSEPGYPIPNSNHLATKSTLKAIGLLASIIAATAVVIGIIFLRPNEIDNASSQAIVAEVLWYENVELDGNTPRIKAGDQLSLRRIQLTKGTITLRLKSGVVLDLIAPLDGTFESPMKMHLAKGRLNADVGKSGQGFTIVTHHGDIIDLGTRFGIDVSDNAAEVAVFDGEVEIGADSDDNNASRLKVLEGEGIHLSKGSRPRRLSAVWLSQDAQGLSNSKTSSVVLGVSDNAITEGFHRFYGIISKGMAEGTVAYTTDASTPRREVLWKAAPGQPFPAELIGADVVCPFHTDRKQQSLTISLELGSAATVYVMHDRRRSPPQWLSKEFQRTNIKLRSGPWRLISPLAKGIEPDPDGRIHVTYTVWKKNIANAGIVPLGPPQKDGDQGNKAMYGIAVKAAQ